MLVKCVVCEKDKEILAGRICNTCREQGFRDGKNGPKLYPLKRIKQKILTNRPCPFCHKDFIPNIGKQIYCSPECKSKANNLKCKEDPIKKKRRNQSNQKYLKNKFQDSEHRKKHNKKMQLYYQNPDVQIEHSKKMQDLRIEKIQYDPFFNDNEKIRRKGLVRNHFPVSIEYGYGNQLQIDCSFIILKKIPKK